MSEKMKWFCIVLLFAIGVPLIIGLALCLIDAGDAGKGKDNDLAVLFSILVGIWIGIMLVLHIKGFFKSLNTSTFTKPTTSLSAAASPSKPVNNDLLSVTRACIVAALIILAGCITALLIILALPAIYQLVTFALEN